MQIQLPDDPKLESRAFAAGLASVEAYVRHLIEQADRQVPESVPKGDEVAAPIRPDGLSYEEWQQRLRGFVSKQPSTNPHFDDSRENMYQDRSS